MRLVIGAFEVDSRFSKSSARATGKVVAVDRGWGRESGEGIERLEVVAFSPKTRRRSDAGQRQLALWLAVQVKELHPCMRVLHIRGDKSVVDDRHAFQDVGSFRHDGL